MSNAANTRLARILLGLLISASVVKPHVAAGQGVPAAIATQETGQAASSTYLAEAAAGINTLQSWYVQASGTYQTTAWWNDANIITVLADFSKASGSKAYVPVFQNTYMQAQKLYYGFINNFYDDEGWWALAWIDAYDVTGDRQYLSMAQSIFEDMAAGWDSTTCGGGIWWSKDRKYKNAIANELFLSVSTRLANRMADPAQKAHYLTWAKMEWQWFSQSGMINQSHLINDGLDSSDPLRCVNNGQAVWSYNQGVVLGGLVALSNADNTESAVLATAKEIADAALAHLTDANGVLHDPGEAKGGPDGGGVQFKGIFVRNLLYLYEKTAQPQYKSFFTVNADSIWNHAQGAGDKLGQVWSGPYGGASAGTQSSAIDALVAAAQAVNPQHLP